MKKKNFVIILLMFFIPLLVNADELKSPSSAVWGDDTSVFNSGFTGQESVTDTKMNKAIKALKERSLTKKQKKLMQEVKPISPLSDMEHLKNFTDEQTIDEGLGKTHTVTIPVRAYTKDGVSIPPGYYKLSCRKIAKDMYVLDLAQGTKTLLSVEAKQTAQDLEQESISFCNAEIIDNNRIRLIYGSIELNLVGYLYYD